MYLDIQSTHSPNHGTNQGHKAQLKGLYEARFGAWGGNVRVDPGFSVLERRLMSSLVFYVYLYMEL